MRTQCPKAPRCLALGAICTLLAMTFITALSAHINRPPTEAPDQAAQAAIAMSHLQNELQQLN